MFLYLGQTITYNNSDWAAVYLNLRKARRRWGIIARVLKSIGETVRSWRAMYKEVTQLVMLYGSKIWVVTGEILKVLMAFHHWVARRITGMTAKREASLDWEYPAVDEALDAAGIHPIEVHIKRR